MLWNLLLVLSAVAVKPDLGEDDISGIELRPLVQEEPDAKPSSSGFRFELHCGSIGSTNCGAAQNSLELVGRMISNDILIRVPITVKVSFVVPSREDRPVLPWSYPVIQKLPVAAQKSDGNSVGQLMSYPQTLVKQLDGPGKSNSGIPDVTLRLDAAKWNFDPDNEFTRDDRNPLRDFELTIAQMLTISMGFRSELICDRGKEVVSTDRIYVNPEFSYMRYITPFDALINKVTLSLGQRCIEMIKPGVCQPTYEPIAPIAKQLEPFQMKNLPHPTNFDESYKKATSKLFTMFDSKELAAKFADGTTLKLDGIHHGIVHDSLFETEDFLMTYKARHAGVGSLRQLMKRFRMRSYYGPGTLKVLESIGWSLRKSPKTIKLIKSENGKELLIGLSTFKSV